MIQRVIDRSLSSTLTVEYTRPPREIFSSRLAALFTIDDGDDRGVLCLQLGFLEPTSRNVSREILLFRVFYPQKGSKKPVGRQFVPQFSRLSNQVSSN